MTFIDFLQREMKTRDWNESDLARAADISRQAVNFLLSGRSKSPSQETIEKIAKAFGLPVESVYRHVGILPPKTESNDPWAEDMLVKIQKLPAQSRNAIEHLIAYFYEQEHGKKGKR